ncbi:MAG: cytochrome P460 family protein [Planctomycetaceae bacterium]
MMFVPGNRRAELAISLGLLGLGVSLWLATGAAVGQRPPVPQATSARGPRYSPSGELLYPDGFEEWIFVGSNLGLEYTEGSSETKPAVEPPAGELRSFHNVYIDPVAFAEFSRTGIFPDPTVLVLDIYKARKGDAGSFVSAGLFPADRQGVAVAVKNSRRPDGGRSTWAYYDFATDAKSAKAFADKTCFDCHLEHGSTDNVFVQFYPVLKSRQPAENPATREESQR